MTYKEKLAFEKAELRKRVRNKFYGRCAYCGCDLDGCFQVDHVIPKRRYKIPHEHGLEVGTDEEDNLMPCCYSCNSCKSDLSLEGFRYRIEDRIARLNNTSEYVIAKRFGLLKETNTSVVFFFEKFYSKING